MLESSDKGLNTLPKNSYTRAILFFVQAEAGIRDVAVTGVQTCALPICLGSGVICSSNGVLVTNAHVVRSTRPAVQLWDGREFEASVQSRDPWRDLAELRIDAVNLPAASVADSSQVRPGELAIAIGNPMGFVGALATGVIHGVGPLRGLGSQNWVQ